MTRPMGQKWDLGRKAEWARPCWGLPSSLVWAPEGDPPHMRPWEQKKCPLQELKV